MAPYGTSSTTTTGSYYTYTNPPKPAKKAESYSDMFGLAVLQFFTTPVYRMRFFITKDGDKVVAEIKKKDGIEYAYLTDDISTSLLRSMHAYSASDGTITQDSTLVEVDPRTITKTINWIV
jgi:hypothetical protein